MTTARIDAFGMTDVGKRRSNNEDQFFISSLHKSMTVRQTSLANQERFETMARSEAFLLMVADGVGGLAGGEYASGLAVETVTELVAQAAGCYYGCDVEQEHGFLEHLERAVRRTHDVVRNMFGGKGQGPATTLTMVTLIWPRAYFVHIGDSRCYYLHGDRLRQLTRDQTMGAMLVDEGVMTEQQAERASLDNVLASAIGGEIDPSIGLVDLDDEDILMLCSDGLTKHVPDEEIQTLLTGAPDAETACRALVQAALDGGGSDNVTAVVARRSS